jgi:hypothetical protein
VPRENPAQRGEDHRKVEIVAGKNALGLYGMEDGRIFLIKI